MMNIIKRSGKEEEFSKNKIEKSIRSAGGDEKTAREISGGVKHKEGLRTSDVRRMVSEKLTQHDVKLGKAYEFYKKPVHAEK